eukprot:gnl/Chilomastix_cuspidata/1496.p1 GENE.gnl/Chilomastix_cuspidata/1496~~gnl/Chilomastix_cuspidata/1496.p1  ORF type:complete len:517 (-),score=147.11 gnl/Chilomastix_cuspidata/1496:1133-2683(-)
MQPVQLSRNSRAISFMICPIHGEFLKQICNVCNCLVCEKCIPDHHLHLKALMDVPVGANSYKMPDDSVADFKKSATKLIPTIRVEVAALQAATTEDEAQLAQLRANMRREDEFFQNDIQLVDEFIEFLNARRPRALTKMLGDAFVVAKKAFDVEEGIKCEVLSYARQAEALERTLHQSKRRILFEEARRRRLEAMTTWTQPGSVPFAPEVLRLDLGTLSDPIGNYSAFPGAESLACVTACLAVPLRPFNSVRISAAVTPVEDVPGGVHKYNITTLSDTGILCSRDWDSKTLFLSDLLSGRNVELHIPDVCWACVYAGALFVGVWQRREILHAPVFSVFEGLQVADFSAFAVPAPIFYGALETANRGWIVYRSTVNNSVLVRVDLAARTGTVVRVEPQIDLLGTLSGIDVPGVMCVGARLKEGYYSLAIARDGSTRRFHTSRGSYPVVLPSRSAPFDLDRALVLNYASAAFYGDQRVALDDPVSLEQSLSIVRVFRDVFLCFDRRRLAWVAVRIAVP